MPEKLSPRAQATIVDPNNDVLVSSISFWKISLKYALGKLDLTNVAPDELPELVIAAGLGIVEAMADDMASFYRLPAGAHKDPFDRLIAWLAIRNQTVLISSDPAFSAYSDAGLRVCW
jgi:PIN domain nuclease of toxin-antitoxin system